MARPRSDIDKRIVHAALGCFLAEGVDGTSLRTIARAARTNLGMISYYFPKKDDLFLAVVEEVYAGLLLDLEAILADKSPGVTTADRVGQVSIRIGSMSQHEVDVIRLIVREALTSSTRFRQLLERFKRGHIPLLWSIIGDGVVRGEIDTRLPPNVLLGAVFGMGVIPQVLRRALADEVPMAFPSVEETAAHSARVLERAITKQDQ